MSTAEETIRCLGKARLAYFKAEIDSRMARAYWRGFTAGVLITLGLEIAVGFALVNLSRSVLP